MTLRDRRGIGKLEEALRAPIIQGVNVNLKCPLLAAISTGRCNTSQLSSEYKNKRSRSLTQSVQRDRVNHHVNRLDFNLQFISITFISDPEYCPFI